MAAPGARKLVLTTHVVSSVGWLGAVAGFLALALAGLSSPDVLRMRAAYLAMDLLTREVIVPLCVASLLTGVVASLVTPWGLVRHYWVLVKLLMTVAATLVLMMHTQPIRYAASVAVDATSPRAELDTLGTQLAAEAGAALAVLLVATTLSVYKPSGTTGLGQREPGARRPRDPSAPPPGPA
jgi:hypothetical protein